MAPLLLSDLASCFVLALLSSRVIASPIAAASIQLDESKLHKRSDLQIVKTTVTPSGQVIDWIPIESQGNIVYPSDGLPGSSVPFVGSGPTSELLLPGVELGPAGTVPIPRMSQAYLTSHASKQSPPHLQASLVEKDLEERASYAGTHWYVNSDQSVTNYGSQASYSLFKAYTQSQYDFSLLQTAVYRDNAQMPGTPSQTTLQTLEAGWINYPYQVSQPHIFTYYTLNDYQTEGDYAGGWNTDHKGWVQTSSTYYPGVVLTPLSQVGGTQDEVVLTYHLNGDNWYLVISGTNIQSQIMGYYPAGLFRNHTTSGSLTLSNSSSGVAFYGEIYQSESALTTTDMGSGNFGAKGYKQAAYMRNMIYLDEAYNNYAFTAGFGDSNSSMYSHGHGTAGGSNWGNYIYLGGPGAGGVVNG